jgi:excisionase family DNA binding protein
MKMTEEQIPDFYTLGEAVEPLKMSRGTIYRKAKEGKLKLIRDAGGRHIILKTEVVRYLNGGWE